jgi:hypothetical protein
MKNSSASIIDVHIYIFGNILTMTPWGAWVIYIALLIPIKSQHDCRFARPRKVLSLDEWWHLLSTSRRGSFSLVARSTWQAWYRSGEKRHRLRIRFFDIHILRKRWYLVDYHTFSGLSHFAAVYVLRAVVIDLQTDKVNSTHSGHTFVFGQSSAKRHYYTDRVEQFNPWK